MSQSKTYHFTDPAELAAKVLAEGGPKLDPTQPSGQASADGVTIGWDIQCPTIEITILAKPWIMPYSAIWSHVDELFAD